MPPSGARKPVSHSIDLRTHPLDRAIAVYGVVPAEFAGRRFTVDGHRTIVVRSGSLALVASYVDPGEFSTEEIERRRTDRKWMQERARHHERVLDRLGARGSIVPTPLLTAYEDLGALESAVRRSRARWNRALARLTGKVEYCLHVFEGPHALPGTEPYVLRVSLRARRERTPRREPKSEANLAPLAMHRQELWDACVAASFETRRFDAPGVRGFAFGGALLIDESADDALRLALTTLEPAGHALGVTVYLEGPRLPFSFG